MTAGPPRTAGCAAAGRSRCACYHQVFRAPARPTRPRSRVPIVQRPRTWPFQGQNTGSNPVGDATLRGDLRYHRTALRLPRNDLDRRRRISPAPITVSRPDREGLDSGSHVGRNAQVNIERPRWAAACRALGKSDCRGPSKEAKIRLDTIAGDPRRGCVRYLRDASQAVVGAATKRSEAPRRYAELTGSGTRRNHCGVETEGPDGCPQDTA